MKTLMFKLALATTVVVGAGAVVAQEMGTAEATPKTEVAAENVAAITPAVQADDGEKIAVDQQKEDPAQAVEQKRTRDPNAQKIVLEMLKPLSPKYHKDRRAIIQIGYAMAPVKNPHESPNYIQVRDMLAKEAVLNAKVQIVKAIRQTMSAAEAITTMDNQDAKAFQKKHAEEYAELERQRNKTLSLLAQLDEAEAAKLKGRSFIDNWDDLMKAIIKRIDKDYDPNQAQADKVAKYEAVKAAYEEAKKTLKALDKAAKSEPIGKNVTDFETYFDMNIYGINVLCQAESYDHDGNYEVAVAVVWSPKLQERALKVLNFKKSVAGKKGEQTIEDWLADNEKVDEKTGFAPLAAMVGPRNFTDNEGKQYVLGIAACEIPKNANRRQNAMEKTDLSAQQTVLFSLYEQVTGNQTKHDEMLKYDGEDNANAKENDTLGTYTKVINGIVSKRPVSGMMIVHRAELVHPISGKDIYVAVATIDGDLAEASEEFLDEMSAAAAADAINMNEAMGREAGRKAVVEEARKSKAAFERGKMQGAKSVGEKLNAKRSKSSPTTTAIPMTGNTSAPAKERKSQTGVFSGDSKVNDDF